jgi:hypothetical protein
MSHGIDCPSSSSRKQARRREESAEGRAGRASYPRMEILEDRILLSFTAIAAPTLAYTSTTFNMAASIPANGTTLTTLADGTETLTFSGTLTAGTVPATWTTWNTPPAVESSTPRIFGSDANSVTISLSAPAVTFGVEVEPSNFASHSITATFMDGASVVGTVSRNVSGNSGALLFAGTTDQLFTSVVITADGSSEGFALAQPRYLVTADVVLTGDAVNNQFLVQQDGDGFIDCYQDGVLVSHELAITVQGIYVSGFGGNDTLTIDISNGLITPTDGIQYDGGAGFNQLQILQGESVPTQTTDVYSVGHGWGDGTSVITGAGGVQTIYFQNLAPVLDTVAAATFIVNGTPSSNAISYTAGSTTANGLVTIDDFESVEFSNKAALVLNAGGGSDEISLNNLSTPTGLTGITVNGGDPTGSDTVIINGTPAGEAIGFAPTAADAGTVTIAGLPTVTLTGTEHLLINGQSGGDALTVTTPASAGGNLVWLTPGALADQGSIVMRQSQTNQNWLGLSFDNLGRLGSLVFANTNANDTLSLSGTNAEDGFLVDGTGLIQLVSPTALNAATLVEISTPGIGSLVLNGMDGDDFFIVASATPFDEISISGGDPIASDILLVDVTGANPVTVDLQAHTVQQTGFALMTMAGIEQLAISGAAALTFMGTDNPDTMRYTPTGAAAGIVTLDGQNLMTTFDTLAGTLTLDPAGGNDTVVVNGTALADTIAVARGATTTVQVGALKTVTVGANDEVLALAAGAGDDTINVTGTGGPALNVDGGPPTASDTLAITTITGTTTVNPGTTPDSGVILTPGGDVTAFTGIESLVLTGTSPGAAATLQINGTQGSDLLKLLAGPVINQALVNDRAPINFSGFDAVVLDGVSGNDTFDVSPVGLVGVTGITVHGHAPVGAADVIVNGSSAAEAISVVASSTSVAVVTVGASAPVTVDPITSLTVKGLAGNDVFTVTGAAALAAPITLDGAAGNDTFAIGVYTGTLVLNSGAGSDTVSFATSPVGVTMDLDLINATQQVNTNGLTVKLTEAVENFIGSAFNDQVYVDALVVARSIDGGAPVRPGAGIPPGDMLSFDSLHQTTTLNRVADNGVYTAFGYAPITFTSIEKPVVSNSLNQADPGPSGSSSPFAYNPAIGYTMKSTMPRSVAVGDVNGDGFQDMVTVNSQGAGVVCIRLGIGNGTFRAAVSYATGVTGCYDVRLAEINGLPGLDIVTAGKNNQWKDTVVVLNNIGGAGVFTTKSSYVTRMTGALGALSIGDVDLNGANDVLIGTSNQLMILRNTAGVLAVPTTPQISGGSDIHSVALADVTGDGYVDIVAANFRSNSVSLFRNTLGAFTHTPTHTYSLGKSSWGPTSLVVADFNNDGLSDIATSNQTGNAIGVLLGNGTGSFTLQPQAKSIKSGFQAIAAGDANGDGIQDLIIAHAGYGSAASIQILLGTGNGTFSDPFTFATGGQTLWQPASIATGDFNNDGGLDIAVACPTGKVVSVLLKASTV